MAASPAVLFPHARLITPGPATTEAKSVKFQKENLNKLRVSILAQYSLLSSAKTFLAPPPPLSPPFLAALDLFGVLKFTHLLQTT